jgi:cell division protein ZapA
MGQVTVTVNGRTYRLRCGEGEERRLLELAAYVNERVDGIAMEFGQIGDDRLLLMAALLIADELWDTREQLWRLEAESARSAEPPLTAEGRGAASSPVSERSRSRDRDAAG